MRTVIIYFFTLIHFNMAKIDSFVKERNHLLRDEIRIMLGNDIVLTDNEERANDILMKLKREELNHAFHHPQMFNLSKHFFQYKEEVKESELFKLIQKMPKGAVLHAHDTGILGPDYVLGLTYWDDLYIRFEGNNVRFLFSSGFPESDGDTEWRLLKDARYSSENVEKFDADLRKYFTLVIDNPNDVYSDINTVWSKFQMYFINTHSLFSYIPVWRQYFYDTLKACREDNVMYIEIRSILPQLYDLDGNVYSSIYTAQVYKEVLDQFLEDYPDFYGAKLIFAPLKLVDKETVSEYLVTARKIKKRLPDFFAGFDLVGQEDLGVPIKEFLPELIESSDKLDYFLHAGETNWYGTSSDENLVDAIVLGSKRIGHAFALTKHPLLMEKVKLRDIAIEVNVVSNSVLRLVSDVRNHPLATFLANGMPVVISSDDPGVWEADPLSHDFYVVFLGVSSRHADLRLLKKLALNSLYYSTYPDKNKIIHEFEIRWMKFIDSVVNDKW